MSRSTSVLFPAPGGPVMPTRRTPASPVFSRNSRAETCDRTCSKPSLWFSTSEMARARAAGSPRSSPASRVPIAPVSMNLAWSLTAGAAIEGDRADWARAHQYPVDARRGCRQHVELEPAQQEPLARARDSSGRGDQEPAHRLHAAGADRESEGFGEPLRGRVSFELDHPCGLLSVPGSVVP